MTLPIVLLLALAVIGILGLVGFQIALARREENDRHTAACRNHARWLHAGPPAGGPGKGGAADQAAPRGAPDRTG